MSKVFTTDTGRDVERVSRWIQIQHNYNPNKNNRLYDYATDGNGYRTGSERFNPADGVYLDYFRWSGRTWAIEQFLYLGGPWGGGRPYMFTDVDGKTTVISAYDCENYYNPIMIEIDDSGERVRVYQDA